jgi:dTDP-4-dehydrorhamnose reductase
MLGHKLLQRLGDSHQVWGAMRGEPESAPAIPGVDPARLIGHVGAADLDSIRHSIARAGAEAVLNCIGIVKQIEAGKDAVESIGINALLPHQLSRLCAEAGVRLIHFSTDCVFSCEDGPHLETDPPNPADLYGRTKLLGELDEPHCFTIRSSIIGRELKRGTGLVEWFIAQRGGRVRGYRHALYTGLTTRAMADVVRLVLESHPNLSGVWQVAADPIDKCRLLEIVNRVYGLGIVIEPYDDFHCDRRLDSTRFRTITGWTPAPWESMIESMHADPLL